MKPVPGVFHKLLNHKCERHFPQTLDRVKVLLFRKSVYYIPSMECTSCSHGNVAKPTSPSAVQSPK